MNPAVLKVLKIVVPVASILVTGVSNYVSNKELDEKVAKKVSEALANMAKES